jgi:hypothetical protein
LVNGEPGVEKKEKGRGVDGKGEEPISPALFDLLQPGNVGLLRLLVAIREAGAQGITTNRLIGDVLHSTNHGQAALHRAHRLGLIDRQKGEAPGPGQFPPVYNKITDKGRQLLEQARSALAKR